MSLAELVIASVKVEGRSTSEVARDYKISRYWVQQLVKGYEVEGDAAFAPRSRRPHSNSPRGQPRGRGPDHPAPQGPVEEGPRRRRRDDPDPSADRRSRPTAVGLDDLADPDPPRLRHSPAKEAAQGRRHTILRRDAQRTVAGRHHPLAARRRHRRGDPQHHRRPLPVRPHLQGPEDHHRPRRPGQLPRHIPPPRHPRQRVDRQRRDLHRQTPPRWPGRPRDRARPARRPTPPLPPLPPADLRKGRAVPPDPEEVARSPTARGHPRRPATPARPVPPLLQHRPTPPGDRPTPPEAAYTARPKARPPKPSIPVHYRVGRDKTDPAGVITLRYDSQLRHIGLGREHARKRVLALVADRYVRVVDAENGGLLRELTLDYQPHGRPPGPRPKAT